MTKTLEVENQNNVNLCSKLSKGLCLDQCLKSTEHRNLDLQNDIFLNNQKFFIVVPEINVCVIRILYISFIRNYRQRLSIQGGAGLSIDLWGH